MSNEPTARAGEQPQGQLFVLSAPSGAGKTTLSHALIERLAAAGCRVRFSVSYTTRPPRPEEQDGTDYHFITPGQFDAMAEAGGFLEHARVFGHAYGTGREATEALLADGVDVILDIDWQGARQVRAARSEAVTIFIQPPSLEALEQRLRQRGQDDEATIARRMREAEAEMSHRGEFDHIIVNDDFAHALHELETLFTGNSR